MCGIAGLLLPGPVGPADVELVRRMTARLAHRGPDGDGIQEGERFVLGHRRLAILDREGGAQPLATRDGRYVLVYNGEVYNYAEVARELGVPLRTRCDTEVVLEALARWGLRALDRFAGMFAFACVDTRAQRAWLGRDRLGVKPLFWARVGPSLVFASEPKALFEHDALVPRPDPLGLSAFLSFRHPLARRSLYQGVQQVGPGEVVEVDLADPALGARATAWWTLPIPAADRPRPTLADTSRLVESRFLEAVRARLIADVPLGAYLSGGLDSSLVVAAMTLLLKQPVRTFCVGFEADPDSELDAARAMAAHCGAQHGEIRLTAADYLAGVERAIEASDGPLAVPNEVPLLHLSFAMKQVFSVVLSGEGADELFGGYGRIFRSADDAAVLAALREAPDLAAGPAMQTFLAAARQAYGDPLPADHVELFLRRYRYLPLDRKREILSPDVLAQAGEDAVDAPLREHFARLAHLHPVEQFLHVFEVHHLPGLLRRLDATTMAAGLEARVPFCDHRLVEAVQELPWDLKLRFKSAAHARAAAGLVADQVSEVHDTPKWILRQALGPLLPEATLARRKVGFPVPLAQWTGSQGVATRWMLDVLDDPATRQRGVFDGAALGRLTSRLAAGSTPATEARHAFYLACIELWLRGLAKGAGSPLARARG